MRRKPSGLEVCLGGVVVLHTWFRWTGRGLCLLLMVQSSNRLARSETAESVNLLEAETERRKRSHIETTLQQDVQFRTKKTGFDDVELVHNAVPGINRDDVDLRVKLFGRV